MLTKFEKLCSSVWQFVFRVCLLNSIYMSHVMRKPVYAICEQQRRRSAYMRNFKPLASLWSCAGWFESHLVRNPEHRFSRDVAHIWMGLCMKLCIVCVNNKGLTWLQTCAVSMCTVSLEPLLFACVIKIFSHGLAQDSCYSWGLSQPYLGVKNEPPHDKTNEMACAPSEDSDQLGHPLGHLISLRCSLVG